jgi:hypothetical protein
LLKNVPETFTLFFAAQGSIVKQSSKHRHPLPDTLLAIKRRMVALAALLGAELIAKSTNFAI